ncbi:MAG: FG-GAP-like repeat-containing protein [Pseudohongiellaceae bacterium]
MNHCCETHEARFSAVRWLVVACCLIFSHSEILIAEVPSFTQQAFTLPASAESLVIADLNGDNLNDLVTLIDSRLRVYFQRESGFDFESGFKEISFESRAVGWDLNRGFGTENQVSVIALLDGKRAVRFPINDESILPPQTIASELPGFISRGINRLHFARDINADGMTDLVIPGAGEIHLLINEDGGNFEAPLSILSETRLRTQLNINRFNRSAGQAVRIPNLTLRDVNADSREDLVVRTEEKLEVFLAGRTPGRYFPLTPDFLLDIAAIEENLGQFDIDNLDFSNLTGVLALTHEEILEDIDGDGIDDLLLREGGKVSIFTGQADGVNTAQARQILRSGGNVLSTFLYDENGDGLKDLWLWRVESISVGDIFVWLALSGSIAIEAFIYPNNGERFERRPARKVTVDLKFPSVLRLANAYQTLNNEAETLQADGVTRTASARLDSPDEDNDLLVLMNDQIRILLNSIEPAREDSFLGALDYSRNRDNYEIDIRDIINSASRSGNPYRDLIDSREATDEIALSQKVVDGDLIAARLNDDERDDIIVFTHFDASQIQGLLLLSQ